MRRKVLLTTIFLITIISLGNLQTYAQAESRVGLVIQFDPDTEPEVYCISFEGETITGDKLLQLALEKHYLNDLIIHWDNMGGAICKINDLGCPEDSCLLCKKPYYWSYWHLAPDNHQWIYSVIGASSYEVHNKNVEGWAWSDIPATPPTKLFSFDEICNSPTATATSTSTATNTPKPTFTLTSTPTELIIPTDTFIPTNTADNAIIQPTFTSTPTTIFTNTPIPTTVPTITSTAITHPQSTSIVVVNALDKSNPNNAIPKKNTDKDLQIKVNENNSAPVPSDKNNNQAANIPLGIIIGAGFVGFLFLISVIGIITIILIKNSKKISGTKQ